MDGQTVFVILVGAALASFSLVMVSYAFFRGNSPEDEGPVASEFPADVGVGLDAIYDSIDTLELEYQLGNVPEEQYRQQLDSYRIQVAVVVRAMLERGDAPPELLLEQEVLAARSEARRSSSNSSEGETWRACPQCDAPIPPDDVPCPHCGAATFPLPQGEG